MHYLSNSESSRNLTARAHPVINTTKKKHTATLFLVEELQSNKDFFGQRNTVGDVLSQDTVQCWDDVMAVLHTL